MPTDLTTFIGQGLQTIGTDLGITIPDWAQGVLQGFSNVSLPSVAQQVVQNNPISRLLSPAAPTQQGPGSGMVPADGTERNYSTIRQKMIDHLGFAPRRKTVNFMLRRMGADFTETALGIDQNDVLWLFTHKRTSARRHFVETYMKWCHRGDRARHRLAQFARKCGGARGAARARHHKRQPAAVRIIKVPSK